tara:strand:- start:28604 stop:28975 length:372 start_codon:yes stop_codon:yes gene_type:complete
MANKPANAAQKKWMKDIAEWADGGVNYLYSCDDPKGFQLHHVLGRSAKHNKIHVGHWFIIPVPFSYHDINEKNDLNVSYFKHNFTNEFGLQSVLFERMCNDMENLGYEIPPDDAYYAILDTRA